jgi:hypothetical protein
MQAGSAPAHLFTIIITIPSVATHIIFILVIIIATVSTVSAVS